MERQRPKLLALGVRSVLHQQAMAILATIAGPGHGLSLNFGINPRLVLPRGARGVRRRTGFMAYRANGPKDVARRRRQIHNEQLRPVYKLDGVTLLY